jgi:putative ABC transport system permease protein
MAAVFLQALRSWTGAKAIAVLATIAFAVGIGSTTAIYTVVNAVMLAPLPYANGDRFVALYGARFSEPGQFSSSTLPDLQEYQRRTTSFDVFGWFRLGEFNMTSPGEPRHVSAVSVTPDLAHNLGVVPIAGQWFGDETGAVISNRLWRRLGADRSIVGRAMTLDGRALTITGVMPPAFRLPVSGPGGEGFESDVWVYLDPLGGGLNPAEFFYFAYARRKPGVTLAQAEADVKGVAAAIAALAPASHPSYTARLVDLRDSSVREIRPTLLLLFAAAGLLLLITCANVAGLLLARSVARARDTATRVALGIPQRRLALHFFAEGLLVSLAGAAAGVVASVGLVRLVVSIGSDFVPRADEIAMDWTVLAFALGTAVLTSVLSSAVPLWQAVRTAPIDALSAGARASAGARVRRLSQSLVIAEIALAFTLLAVGAALIVHLQNLGRTPPGFDADHLLTFSISIPDSIASDDAARPSYQKRLVEALAALPGATGAGFANHLPLTGCCLSTTIHREGHPVESRAVERTSYVIADPGFFRAMRIPLRRGRYLTEADTSEDPVHVVLNQAAATRYWGEEDPIDGFGRLSGADGTRFQVVGVVGDVRNNGLGNPTVPEIYMPSAIATANPMQFVVRSPLPAARLVPDVRRAVQRIDPTLPIHDAQTLTEIVRGSMALERVGSLMTSFFALAALLMATLGVYGLVAYAVRQRTVEIGTRMALGASSRDVLSLVIGGGLKMAAAGVVLGGVAIIGAVSLLERFFDLHDIGWLPFTTSTVIVAVVTAAASSFPAWRATRLSPMVAIRDESQSAWESARTGIRKALKGLSQMAAGAAEPSALSDAALLADFVAAARRAESPADQIRIALATLRSRLGAESALLLEKVPTGEYRCTAASPGPQSSACTLPAHGFLLGRLQANSSALPMTSADLEVLARWAAEHKPERLDEIETLKSAGARLAAALRTKNEILGLLMLGPPVERAAYGAAEKAALDACTAQFALMIENGRLTGRVVEQEKLQRDLALAAEVQRRLLPDRPPEVSMATLAAVSLPARSVGGDYFDFIDVGDQRIGIALADVSGKGVAAALIMSSVQASLRILSSETDISLPQLVTKMNRFLHSATGSNKYATFFYAQIDGRARQLRYVNAGHLPPYLLRPASAIQELSTGGSVIGLFPEMSYEEATVDLQPGDVLVAFTDGVTEAMNRGEEEFGEERLKELLRQVVGLPVDEISARISHALKTWIDDTAQYDDLTFVVVKVSE